MLYNQRPHLPLSVEQSITEILQVSHSAPCEKYLLFHPSIKIHFERFRILSVLLRGASIRQDTYAAKSTMISIDPYSKTLVDLTQCTKGLIFFPMAKLRFILSTHVGTGLIYVRQSCQTYFPLSYGIESTMCSTNGMKGGLATMFNKESTLGVSLVLSSDPSLQRTKGGG